MAEQEAGSIVKELEEQAGRHWHIPDEVRVGVLAGSEEYETWLQAHLLRCQECLKPLLSLFGRLPVVEASGEGLAAVACSQARNAIFHYLETGREPPQEFLHHVINCEACSRPFYEPAKNLVLLEFDPNDTGEAG